MFEQQRTGQFMYLLIAVWALSLGAAQLGLRAGAWSRRAATLLAGACCILLAVGAVLAWRVDWLPEALLSTTYAYLQGSWFAPFALGLFFIAARQASDRDMQAGKKTRAVFMYKLLAATVMAVATIGLLDRLDWYSGVTGDLSKEARLDTDGIVRQSTGYTCGAAACANLLRKKGVDPEATERQMAPLCVTRRWDGASLLGMAAGLRSVAAPRGWHVRIVRPDWMDFCRLKMPVLTSIWLNENLGHAVVVLDVDSKRGVQVADPLSGLYWCPEEQFRVKFKNDAIEIYRDSP